MNRKILIPIFALLIICCPRAIYADEEVFGPYDRVLNVYVFEEDWGIAYEIGKERYFNINGETFGPYSNFSSNLHMKNGAWAISYFTVNEDKIDKWYVNVNGQIYGPYDSPRGGEVYLGANYWGFKYVENDADYAIISGTIFSNVSDISISDNNWGVAYEENGEFYANIKNQIYGPYEGISNLGVSDNNWGVVYVENGEFYANIKNQIYGPYDAIGKITVADNNWGFYYKDDEKYYTNIKESIYGPYDSVGWIQLTDTNWGHPININKKYYFNINGQESEPFDLYDSSAFHVLDSGWTYTYLNNDKAYAVINGKQYGPYQGVFYPDVSVNNKCFVVTEDTGNYIVINDKKITHSRVYFCDVSDSGWGYSYEDAEGKSYVKLSFNVTGQSDTKQSGDSGVINLKNQNNKLKGRILLKVEAAGEAYYIHPDSQAMHYLGRPADAFRVMREQGIGISTADLERIPVAAVGSSFADADGDGLSDAFEARIGTDPNRIDTDGDGYGDRQEVEQGYNPLGSGNLSSPIEIGAGEVLVNANDRDGDGLTDALEEALGTDPDRADSDGDGYGDRQELSGGFNPRGAGTLEFDKSFADKNLGKIFLQVEGQGEAWYVNPTDGRRYFLGRPADAFRIMRELGLGVTNKDFDNL